MTPVKRSGGTNDRTPGGPGRKRPVDDQLRKQRCNRCSSAKESTFSFTAAAEANMAAVDMCW